MYYIVSKNINNMSKTKDCVTKSASSDEKLGR